MFELNMYEGRNLRLWRTCDKGDLLPTMASLMQEFEQKYGQYEHQRNYTIQWRRVKE